MARKKIVIPLPVEIIAIEATDGHGNRAVEFVRAMTDHVEIQGLVKDGVHVPYEGPANGVGAWATDNQFAAVCHVISLDMHDMGVHEWTRMGL